MSSLGAYLKSCREEKGISLQKIQEDTKIRLKYLEAIEADRLEILPGEVYIRGFLKTYASSVGLNEEAVIGRYEKMLRSHANIEADGTDSANGDAHANEPAIITTTKIPDLSNKKSLFRTNTRFYIYGLGAMIVLALIFAPLFLTMRDDALISAVDTLGESDSGEENAVVLDEDGGEAVGPGRRADMKTIALSVHFECWVDVRIDGANVEQRTLQPGERPQWSGRNIQIILGNAGGVTLFEDGESKGIPGRNSQRLELEFAVHDE